MKRLFILAFVFSAITFLPLPTLQAQPQHQHEQEIAKVRFNEMYKLKGVLLFGDYLVVHDDVKKANGEECVLFYRVKPDGTQELVVSYRCDAVAREKAKTFAVLFTPRQTPYDVPEIQEIQFAGSAKAHRVL
ncbi:MAG: hypothetical protein U0Y68_19355 [Blastocatellia bacterium]